MNSLNGLIVTDNHQNLSQIAAEKIAILIQAAVTNSNTCHIAIPGGSTPLKLFEILAQPPYQESMPWNKLSIYFTDERWVPCNHSDNNAYTAKTNLFNHVSISNDKIHAIPTELNNPRDAAKAYEQTLRSHAPLNNKKIPELDLIILGMGSDGHTASLFPESHLLNITDSLCASDYIKKLDSHRISLTLPLLKNAKNIIVLVSGEEKSSTIKLVFHKPSANLPIQQLVGMPNCLWIIDKAAAAQL